MNKIVLSAIAALTLGSFAASASDVKLYSDDNGQVFTMAGEGRTEVKTSTPVFANADKLKFSGLTYLGYTYNDRKAKLADGSVNPDTDSSDFEIRRSYLQLKAYLLDDPKSYFRVTFDLTKDATGDSKVRAKYAYLFINNILPATGVEIGLAHRPWHDYEEHNAWYYRNISKVLIEDKVFGADLSNSADFGVMTKTKTQYFDADIGLFNGEGYHSASNGTGMSLEWRTTAHLLGVNGKDKQTKKTYWDASFFGQYNVGHKSAKPIVNNVTGTAENQDLIFGGLHTVFNMPSFLVAAQYVKSQDTSDTTGAISGQAGDGYSVNAEYRFGSDYQYRALARYDTWTFDQIELGDTSTKENKGYILGAAWEQNKNVQWVANVIVTDNEGRTPVAKSREYNNGTQYMLTAEVRF
jgi:hypothetical protein